MSERKFLTALNGKALYAGDYVFSSYHNTVHQVSGIWDDCDGDVYLTFAGGSAQGLIN
jgi:hypothetical protein